MQYILKSLIFYYVLLKNVFANFNFDLFFAGLAQVTYQIIGPQVHQIHRPRPAAAAAAALVPAAATTTVATTTNTTAATYRSATCRAHRRPLQQQPLHYRRPPAVLAATC